MKSEGRWILLVPLVCLAVGAWYVTADRSDVKVAFERAQGFWRDGKYADAAQAYLELEAAYPASRFAPESLWEAGNIYYYNLDDVANALNCYERVIRDYPACRWVAGSRLRLAEIFEIELNEPGNALRYLNEALAQLVDEPTRHDIQFKVAEIHFKLNEFGLAYEEFSHLARDEGIGLHRVHQAKLRLGTIHQIRREHEAAIRSFLEVLTAGPCGDCRLHAQLSLVESYEVLDRLSEAIEIAREIRSEDYPEEMRQQLLKRLLEKKKYYEPGLWGGL